VTHRPRRISEQICERAERERQGAQGQHRDSEMTRGNTHT
jgi:hypothetical protein